MRIIPKLEIKGPNLVKGIHLEGLRVLGKPEEFARYYYQAGADELIYIDVVASLYGRNSLLEIIERTSKEIFIPLTVGGGLRNLQDIEKVLRAGADKVAINTAAIRHPDLISCAARKFGSSTIVLSVAAKRQPDGTYEAYTDNGRERTGLNVDTWVRQAEDLGAGEILLTSIDRDGTGLGYDLELTRMITRAVSIPVTACGGAGIPSHLLEVVSVGGADAVCAASVFHYYAVDHHRSESDFSDEGNTEFLENLRKFTRVHGMTIGDAKQFLTSNNILCRYNGVPDPS